LRDYSEKYFRTFSVTKFVSFYYKGNKKLSVDYTQ